MPYGIQRMAKRPYSGKEHKPMNSETEKKPRKGPNGVVLHRGESYRKKEKRYAYKYKDKDGNTKFLYSPRLRECDPLPERYDSYESCPSLREKEKQLMCDRMHGIDYSGANMTVIHLYDKHMGLNHHVRESTRKGRNQLRKILQNDKLGSMKIGRVTISDAKDWAVRMEEKGYAYQTIKNHKRSLKAIFYTAMDDGCIRANPFNWKMDDKIVKNNTKPKIALTDGQTKSLLSFMQTDRTYSRHYNAVVVLLNTGLRISELCGLTVKDVDFEEGAIHIDHQIVFENGKYRIEPPKTKKGNRTIQIFEPTIQALKKEIQNRENAEPVTIDGKSDFIFLNRKGLPMYNIAYSSAFSAMIKKYNKHNDEKLPDFSPHDLRHTFCTNMANKGLQNTVLQRFMGHESIITTTRYYHGSEESDRKAMESIMG